MKNPLDHKIDALLASRPLRPSEDFAARVLDAAEADEAARRKHPLGKLLAFALPIAAAVVLTVSLLQLDSGNETPTVESQTLSQAEAQEIFLLEESLASLSNAGTTDFRSENLLATLDALYLEI